MTSVDNHEPELGGDDLVAAEYVLGVLPVDERTTAARRIDQDAVFARLVDKWEVHFAPMSSAYPPVEAPAAVKAAVDRRLFAASATQASAQGGLWSSLGFWRMLAAAAIAALAIYVAIPFMAPSGEAPQTRFVASLAAEGSDVHYLAIYDAASGEVSLSHVSGERAAGRDFELWMIEGQNTAPVSMGVIPVGATVHLAVSPDKKAKLEAGAVLAVSLEPAGGSPTGQPTGPVVAAGDLKTI